MTVANGLPSCGGIQNSKVRILATRKSGEQMCGQALGRDTDVQSSISRDSWDTRRCGWRKWSSWDHQRAAPLSQPGACSMRPLAAGTEAVQDNNRKPPPKGPPLLSGQSHGWAPPSNSRSHCWAPVTVLTLGRGQLTSGGQVGYSGFHLPWKEQHLVLIGMRACRMPCTCNYSVMQSRFATIKKEKEIRCDLPIPSSHASSRNLWQPVIILVPTQFTFSKRSCDWI